MTDPHAANFKRQYYQGAMISWAMRWYRRHRISYRELEEMLADRGVEVDHTIIYRWVQRYSPEIEKRLRWHYIRL